MTPPQIPHNIEAERAVLGAILIDNRALFKAASHLQAEHFHDQRHQALFAAFLNLALRHSPIDVVTVSDEIGETNLAHLGGAAYITGLLNDTPTSVHAEHYARAVREAATRRELLQAGARITKLAYDGPADAVDQAQDLILGIGTDRPTQSTINATDLMLSYLERQQMTPEERRAELVPTGLIDLDRLLGGGMHRGDLVVLAARPSMGKTALATCIALHVALRERQRVAFFSLEMSADQLGDRLVCAEAKVDSQRVSACVLDEQEQGRVYRAVSDIGESPLLVDDSAALTVTELGHRARAYHSRYALRLVVVDYLQLMGGGNRYRGQRVQEVAEISQGLKALAKDLRCPVLALSQLSRACEMRADKHPTLADLRDSGAIEQDADVVAFLYREHQYNERTPETEAELHIAKQRNGPTGKMGLHFMAHCMRFDNASL